MKNDPTFKLLAAVILAGVIVAFASPSHSVDPIIDSAPATQAASTE